MAPELEKKILKSYITQEVFLFGTAGLSVLVIRYKSRLFIDYPRVERKRFKRNYSW